MRHGMHEPEEKFYSVIHPSPHTATPKLSRRLLVAFGLTLLTLAMMFMATLMLTIAILAAGKMPGVIMTTPGGLIVGAIVTQGSVLAVVLGAAYYWRKYWSLSRQASLAELFPAPTLKFGQLFGALLVCFGVAPLALWVAGGVGDALEIESASTEIVRRVAEAPIALFLVLWVCISILPGIIEEALFRGVMTRLFAPWYWVSWVVPSLLFGLVHVDVVQSIGTAILGLGFGWIRLRSQSIVLPMIAHAAYNGSVLIAARYATETEEAGAIPFGVVAGGLLFASLGSWLLERRKPLKEGLHHD